MRRTSSSTSAVAGPIFRPPSTVMVSAKLPPCSRTGHLSRDGRPPRALLVPPRELGEAVGGELVARDSHLRDRALDVGALALDFYQVVHLLVPFQAHHGAVESELADLPFDRADLP